MVSYPWGPRGPEARIGPDENVLWYLYDKHGNVLGEVDANGVTNPNSQGLPTPLRKYDVWGGVRNAGQVLVAPCKPRAAGSLLFGSPAVAVKAWVAVTLAWPAS